MRARTGWFELTVSLLLAASLWWLTFGSGTSHFWLLISLSAFGLALTAFYFDRSVLSMDFTPTDLLWGVGSALVLYGIFYLGHLISGWLFSFASRQVSGIYARGGSVSDLLVVFLLLFVTGPAEEIFWRGFLQKNLVKKLGELSGILVAAFFYAAVHLPAANFMLIGAAGVAGLFWGTLYWRLGRLAPLIISHSLWSVLIFVVWPIR